MDSGGLWRDHRFRRVGAVLPEGQTLLLEPTLPRDLLDPPEGVKVVWVGEQPASGGVWYWDKIPRVSTYDLPPLPPG